MAGFMRKRERERALRGRKFVGDEKERRELKDIVIDKFGKQIKEKIYVLEKEVYR